MEDTNRRTLYLLHHVYSHPTDGYNIYKGQEGNQECPVCLGISGNDLSTFVNNNTRRAGGEGQRGIQRSFIANEWPVNDIYTQINIVDVE